MYTEKKVLEKMGRHGMLEPNQKPRINTMNMQSEQVNELFKALSRAQGQLKAAVKDSKNPFFKSYYADLSSVFEACRMQLSENDLCISQTMHFQDGQHFLITTLGHASGQWIKSMAPIISAKPDAQSFGSAVTYQRRYALSAIVGVSTEEDDDGNTAMPKPPQKPAEAPKQAEATKASEPVKTITPAQYEELRLLKATATKETSLRVDDALSKKPCTLKTLPETGYSFIKEILLKGQAEDLTKDLKSE